MSKETGYRKIHGSLQHHLSPITNVFNKRKNASVDSKTARKALLFCKQTSQLKKEYLSAIHLANNNLLLHCKRS